MVWLWPEGTFSITAGSGSGSSHMTDFQWDMKDSAGKDQYGMKWVIVFHRGQRGLKLG